MPDRCFLALELPPGTVAGLARCSAALRSAAPSWRSEKWVSPELFHVTVAFLGALPDSAMGECVAAFEHIAANTPPVSLVFDSLRAVPGLRHASMIWAVAACDAETLASLRDRLLVAAGAPTDPRPVSAHVTLVRARTPRSFPVEALSMGDAMLSDFGKTPDGSVSVPSLTLLSSTLGRSGPSYDVVASFPLRGEDARHGD